MARAKIVHQWAEGSATVLEVQAHGQHPDLLDELTTRVVRMWRETCVDVETEAGED